MKVLKDPKKEAVGAISLENGKGWKTVSGKTEKNFGVKPPYFRHEGSGGGGFTGFLMPPYREE